MRRFVAGCVVLGMSSGMGVQAADERSLAEVVGDHALVYVAIDVERGVTEFESLDVVRLFRDEEVSDFLAPVVEKIRQDSDVKLAGGIRFMAESYGFPAIIGGKVSAALFGVGMPTATGFHWYSPESPLSAESLANEPEYVLPDMVIEVETAGRVAFESTIDRLLEIDPAIVTTTLDGDPFDARVSTLDVDGVVLQLYHTFVGDRFLAAFSKATLHRVAAARGGESVDAPLAADSAYRRWREVASQPDEIVELFVATKTGFNWLRPVIDRVAAQDPVVGQVERMGYLTLRGIGLRVNWSDGRVHAALTAIHPKERAGFLGFFDAFDPSEQVVKGVPSGSNAAASWRIDVPRLIDALVESMEAMQPGGGEELGRVLDQASQQLGIDLVNDFWPSVGTQNVVSASVPRSGFIPDVVASLELRDPDTFREGWGVVVDQMIQESRGGVSVSELSIGENDAAYYKIDGLPFTPAACILPDQILFAITPNLLKRSVRDGGIGAEEGDVTDDLARCVAGASGQHTADIAALLYIDAQTIGTYALGLAETFLPVVASQLSIDLDPALMPFPDTVGEYLSGYLFDMRVGQEYISFDSSSMGIGALVGPFVAPLLKPAQQVRVLVPADVNDTFLGIFFDSEPTPTTKVMSTIVGGPADVGGIELGDVVVKVNGSVVASQSEIASALAGNRPGDRVAVDVQRGDRTVTLFVVLGRRADYVK